MLVLEKDKIEELPSVEEHQEVLTELQEKRQIFGALKDFLLEILKDLHLSIGMNQEQIKQNHDKIVEKALNVIRSNYIKSQQNVYKLKKKLKQLEVDNSKLQQSVFQSNSGESVFMREDEPKISFQECVLFKFNLI